MLDIIKIGGNGKTQFKKFWNEAKYHHWYWYIMVHTLHLPKCNTSWEQGCELTHTHTQKKLPTIQNVYRFHHSWQIALNHFKWARQFCNVTSPLRQFRSSKQIQIQIFCKILLQILITKRYLLYIFMYLYVSSTVLVSMETLKSIWLILSKNFNNLIKKSNLAWSGGSVG